MRRISFGALTAIAVLAASPLMAQAPQTGGKAPETKMAPATTTAPAAKTTAATTADLLDINTATPAQLEALKGVGKVRAEAIVKGRPFKAKDELVSKKLVPQDVYNDIKDKIIARQKS